MKYRTGFKKIVVDGIQYQYAVSFPVDRTPLAVVYSETSKMEIPLNSVKVPERKGVEPTWRGKHNDKAYGKYEVAYLIKHYLAQMG